MEANLIGTAGARRAGHRNGTDPGVMRARILKAAQAEFADKGYAAATTQAIARRAGIQKRMLFYYFQSKSQLYADVLEGFLGGIRDIHARFHDDPGPLGLREIVADLIRLVTINLDPVKILIREIMDDGSHLGSIVEDYIGPLFSAGVTETRRNIDKGVFRDEDPMHLVVNVGGLTIFYFLIVPLLRQVWDRDPLAPETLDERIQATTRVLLDGMLVSGGQAALVRALRE